MSLCECGCGHVTSLAPKTSTRKGWIKGQPVRFVLGHGNSLPASAKLIKGNGFCGCGCGVKTALARATSRNAGRIKGQPVRFIVGHRSRLDNPGHEVDATTGCWNWLGYINPRTGYSGNMRHKGRPEIAHRAYYLKYRGPISAGRELDHTCRNRRCVNPDHLEPVTRPENGRRRAATKLTEELAAQARQLVNAGTTRKAVATQFGVSRSLVSMIVSGQRWT